MRRTEIIEGAREVAAALRDTNVGEVVVRAMQAGPKRDTSNKQLFDTFRQYLLVSTRYSVAAKEIAAAFGLDELEDGLFWGTITEFESGGSRAPRVYQGIRLAVEYLPRLMKLLETEPIPKSAVTGSKSATLTLLLPEEDQSLSKPERIAKALMAISELYDSIAIIEGQPQETLSVISCDSGSDKSFDLLGVAKLVATLKVLLLSVWDRVVFYRELKVEQRLELVASSLPILEKLAELEHSQGIGREQAEILRRNVLHGVNSFLECGAVIPEMETSSHFSPRMLMAPEQKLLTAGTMPNNDSEPDSEDLLSPEERTKLDELQKKSGRGRGRKKD